MKERLGLRRQERLRFSIHRHTKKRFVSTLLHHLNVNVWMYREEKKKFEEGGERTDAILL